MEKTNPRAGQRGKRIEEVVSYAVGHRIRIQVLAILNEGIYSPDELAQMIGEPLGKVSHHVNELLDAGSIELAKTEPVRNVTQHFYTAVEMPFYSDEEIATMTPQQRQVTAGLILQAIMAESLAAFWAGKMVDDRRVWLSWRWFNVDAQGREEIATEQAESWERVREIEAKSTNRRAESGEDAASIIVASLGFERERTSPSPPATSRKN
jgi:DNA-binding transcriptional ArsR family regulator